MAQRFVDRRDRKELIKRSVDFTMRYQGTPIIRIISYFSVVLLLTFVLLSNLFVKLLLLPDGEAIPEDEIIGILVTTLFLGTTVAMFATFLVYKVRENITATEFQNLIFASSVRLNSEFCLIVHQSGIGIYFDPNFSKLFSFTPESQQDPFDKLMASKGFSKSAKDKLMKSLDLGKGVEVPYTRNKQKMHVKLDPIDRPKGFFMLRAYAK